MTDNGITGETERELQKRIQELQRENDRLNAEIVRLKCGVNWALQGEERFADLIKLLPRPLLQTDAGGAEEPGRDVEIKLRHAQKLEAVGALAGGIAHDFNNILTSIIASASLIQRGIGHDSPLRRHLDRIFTAAERATGLTQSILAYSRRQPTTPSPIKLNIIVENLRKLLSRLVPENIVFNISLSDKELMIMADIGQIEHMIMNLVSNAVDAMPDGGKLTIGTGLIETGNSPGMNDFMVPGNYVVLTITDTGIGMDDSVKERLFQPFFTTKEVGKGTGLGLAMAYGIVKQHNGYIEAESEPGSGTSFRIYFPRIQGNLKASLNDYPHSPSKEKKTILLIEDDPDVRNMLTEILESYGYDVIEALDGTDGVEKFRTHKERIHLILSDVMMPGKNGKEAYDEIRNIKSDAKAIFISGYSAVATGKILGEGMDFLAKPVSPLELLTKIREALET